MRKHLLKELVSTFLICVFLLATMFSATARAEVTCYYHTDHLGSPLAMTDAAGSVVWRRNYKPFGEEINLGGLARNTHKFTGKEFDPGTGLYYYGARYYDPVIGRFITVDPAKGKPGNPQSWNRYVYCLNNPYKYVDPNGRFETSLTDFDSGPAPQWFKEGTDILLTELKTTPGRMYQDAVDAFWWPSRNPDQVLLLLLGGELLYGKQAVSEVGAAAKGAGAAADEAFHYTFSRYLSSIESQGLRAGSYATPTGTLSPLQAQIDLALAPNRCLTDALLRIDLAGLRQAGYQIPEITQVGRSFGMPGGGFEMQFPYSIPPQFITVIQP